MPELPEVEANRDLAQKYLVGHVVTQIVCEEGGGGPRDGLFDDIIHEGSTKESLTHAVLNRTLLRACRKGKQMWLVFSPPTNKKVDSRSSSSSADTVESCLLIHFGMTGAFVLQGRQASCYKSFKVHDAQSWPPRFTKLELAFSNGDRLAFCDPRRIGRIRIRGKHAAEEPPISQLAKDALEEVEPGAFSLALRAITTDIKVALLNQEKLVSGIGNWLADEILYQCCIHPQVKCCDLTDAQAQEISQKMNQICKIAAECTCSGKKFPENWLFHYRWTKASSTKAHDALGNAITFETVGGRTSAVVLAVQPKTTKRGLNIPDKPVDPTKKVSGKQTSKGGKKKIKTELETALDPPKSSKFFAAPVSVAIEIVPTAERKRGRLVRPAPAHMEDSARAKRTKR